MGKRILVVTGGDDGGVEGQDLPGAPFDLVIAADSGVDRAMRMEIRPDIVVGDLDSVTDAAIDWARSGDAEIEKHPTEKDHSDLELALLRAARERPGAITVVGGSGGRPDHWMANLALLAAFATRRISMSARLGAWAVDVVVPGRPHSGDAPRGQLVSLIAVGGDAKGVRTSGLTYPLSHEDLPWGSSRGVSNLTEGGPFGIETASGSVLVLRPVVNASVSERKTVE